MNKHPSTRDYNWPCTHAKAEGKCEQEHKNKVRASGLLLVTGSPKGSRQAKWLPCNRAADWSQNGRDHRMSVPPKLGTVSKHDPPSPGDKADKQFHYSQYRITGKSLKTQTKPSLWTAPAPSSPSSFPVFLIWALEAFSSLLMGIFLLFMFCIFLFYWWKMRGVMEV